MLNTYIINLDRAPERLSCIMKQLNPYSEFLVHRVSGVDGKTENFSSISLDHHRMHRYFGQSLSAGTIGCYLSHVQAWEAIYHSKKPYALVLEDDVHFDPEVLLGIVKQLNILQTTFYTTKGEALWDICSFQLNHRGGALPVARLNDGYQLSTYLTCVTGAGAYLLTHHAAKNLLRHAFPVVFPVDHYYTKSHRLALRFLGVEPRIATQRNGISFIEQIGREKLKNLSPKKRFLCGAFRVTEEFRQGLYNFCWAYPLYRKYRA